MKRRPGFSNADGFQDADEAFNIDGFDNCGGCGMNANGEEDDNFTDEYSFNANGEPDAEDGEYNADGERDEFVYNADGEYIGAAGEYNANGEHFDADGDEFQFNIDGEFAGIDGEYNSDGDHIDGFDNFRNSGFSNAEGDEDDSFLNARGKAARQERKAAKQEAKIERKAAKTEAKVAKKAAKTEIKKAKAAAKVEKKVAKTAAKVAKKTAKIERKNTKVNDRVARKPEASAARTAPVDLSAMMPTGGEQVSEEVTEITEAPESYSNAPYGEEYQPESSMEIETDPSMTNVEMTDEETGEPIVDMEEVENFLNANGADSDDDNDHFFISLPGAQRRKTRQAVKTAKKMGKASAKIKKKDAKVNVVQSRADKRIIKATAKAGARETKAQGKAESKILRAPNAHKTTEAISKAASNIGIAAATALGAASLGKSAAKAIAAKKAAGQDLTEEEKAQLAAANPGAGIPDAPDAEGTSEDGGNEIQKKSTKTAGMGNVGMIIIAGLALTAVVGYFISQKGAKKAA
jgi:hypothetical protein